MRSVTSDPIGFGLALGVYRDCSVLVIIANQREWIHAHRGVSGPVAV